MQALVKIEGIVFIPCRMNVLPRLRVKQDLFFMLFFVPAHLGSQFASQKDLVCSVPGREINVGVRPQFFNRMIHYTASVSWIVLCSSESSEAHRLPAKCGLTDLQSEKSCRELRTCISMCGLLQKCAVVSGVLLGCAGIFHLGEQVAVAKG